MIAVVISDLSMPGLGGWEMHAIARQEGMAVPFVFTSGHAAGEVFEGSTGSEDVCFLRKPWTIDDLIHRVHQALEDSARG